jgi:hypothetical protein
MDLSKDKIDTAFAKVIIANRDADPLTLAEKLRERLTYLMEDAEGGSDIMPVRIVDEAQAEPTRTARNRITPVKEKLATAPPAPKSSIILMPDDPEFQEAAKGGASRPSSLPRVSKIGQEEDAGASNVDYWTVEALGKALQDGTPSEFYFVPKGLDDSQKVRAVRNIQWQMNAVGPHMVRLEYKNPGIGDDRSTQDSNGQLYEVVIGLTATKIFHLGMRDLDLPGAMESIVTQLEGLYQPRSQNTEPSGRDPGPLDFNMNDPKRSGPMGIALPKEKMDPNWNTVADPQALVLRSVIQSNQRGGNR